MLMKLKVHNTKTNAETSVFASKEVEFEVNADKNKYMVMFRNQDPRRSHNTKIDNSSSEMEEGFIYLGKKLTNQNSIQEEIKSRLQSGNI